MTYIDVATKHLQAAQEKIWDHPAGSSFKDIEEIRTALLQGKTIEDVYYQCIASYGSVTGGVLNSIFGHASKATIAAVRKGMKRLLTVK